MRILLLGSDDYAPALRRQGGEVLCAGPGRDADLPCPPDPAWRDLARLLKRRGFAPEMVFVCDNIGQRFLPRGMGECEALTIFYGLDSPLNRFWQRPYARLFDLCLLDQAADLPALGLENGRAHWLPVAIEPSRYQGGDYAGERAALCFVGVVNRAVRPKRSNLLARIARRYPVDIFGGRGRQWLPAEEAARLYRQHAVSLNEHLFPGFTTRPLEIMAAGGVLLTERDFTLAGNLFRSGEELATFDGDDLEDTLARLMGDGAWRTRLARQGRARALAEHTFARRAAWLMELAARHLGPEAPPRPARGGAAALAAECAALLWAGLRWPGKNGPARLRQAHAQLTALAALGARDAATCRLLALGLLAVGQGEAAGAYFGRLAEADPEAGAIPAACFRLSLGDEAGFARAVASRGPAGLPPADPVAHGHYLLAQAPGLPLCLPGFNLAPLPAPFWTRLEHIRAAIGRQPGNPDYWLALGDILQASQCPAEAYEAYRESWRRAARGEVREKMNRAGRQGYLQ